LSLVQHFQVVEPTKPIDGHCQKKTQNLLNP
jgi:hypothetical protein